jgi:hypothetical protein
MKKFYSILFISLFSTSCISNYFKIDPKFSDNIILSSSETNKKLLPNLDINLDWQGNAYPLETSKNLVGMPTRFVIPYTRNTILFKLNISNNSENYIKIDPSKIYLKTEGLDSPVNPLTIDYFKKKWPSFAVKNQEMLIDQSIAIGEVIRTIVRNDTILPNSTRDFYIPFNKIPNMDTANIEIILKVNNEDKELSFEFKKK